MEKLLCPSLLNLSMDYLKDEIMRLDVSGADILHIDVWMAIMCRISG